MQYDQNGFRTDVLWLEGFGRRDGTRYEVVLCVKANKVNGEGSYEVPSTEHDDNDDDVITMYMKKEY